MRRPHRQNARKLRFCLRGHRTLGARSRRGSERGVGKHRGGYATKSVTLADRNFYLPHLANEETEDRGVKRLRYNRLKTPSIRAVPCHLVSQSPFSAMPDSSWSPGEETQWVSIE